MMLLRAGAKTHSVSLSEGAGIPLHALSAGLRKAMEQSLTEDLA